MARESDARLSEAISAAAVQVNEFGVSLVEFWTIGRRKPEATHPTSESAHLGICPG